VFASAKRQLKVLRQRRKGDLGSSVSGDVASPEPKPVFAPSLTAAGDGTKGPGPGPMVYATRFESPQGVDWPTLHTFFDSSTGGWSRGVLLVNGFNVGRYWSERGPQVFVHL
jgi:hypothetical protein